MPMVSWQLSGSIPTANWLNSVTNSIIILHRKHAIFYSELVAFPRNSDSKPAESWQHSLGELASYTLTVHTLTIHKFLPALQKQATR